MPSRGALAACLCLALCLFSPPLQAGEGTAEVRAAGGQAGKGPVPVLCGELETVEVRSSGGRLPWRGEISQRVPGGIAPRELDRDEWWWKSAFDAAFLAARIQRLTDAISCADCGADGAACTPTVDPEAVGEGLGISVAEDALGTQACSSPTEDEKGRCCRWTGIKPGVAGEVLVTWDCELWMHIPAGALKAEAGCTACGDEPPTPPAPIRPPIRRPPSTPPGR